MFLTLSVPEITISHHKSQWRKNWKIETKIDLEETFKSLSRIRLVRNIKKKTCRVRPTFSPGIRLLHKNVQKNCFSFHLKPNFRPFSQTKALAPPAESFFLFIWSLDQRF